MGEGNSTPDEEWEALQQVVYNTAKTYLGKPDRTHQDWFDPNEQELQTLMSRRDQAHQRVLQTRSTRSTTAAYKHACRLLQKHTRALKSDWWESKAVELQRAADCNNMKDNKSPGVDGIPPKLLLEIVDQISIPLATMFYFFIRGGNSSIRMERSKHYTII